MTDIQTPGVRGLTAIRSITPGIQTAQVFPLGVINYPTDFMETSQTHLQAANRISGPIEVSQIVGMAAVRGRVQNPRLRAWSFTLDGHDFYVLRLGDDMTFLYDLTTEQWTTYTSEDKAFWRANVGMNWVDAIGPAFENGSNVLVGDDTFGLLWFLNPLQGYDDNVNREVATPVTFPRVATGQIVAKSREYQPVFEVWLNGSNGKPTFSPSYVDLKYSDDAGNNYVSAGPIEVEPSNYNQELSWMSLGRFAYPGRLFRIEDDGGLARIDGMDVNHGTTTS